MCGPKRCVFDRAVVKSDASQQQLCRAAFVMRQAPSPADWTGTVVEAAAAEAGRLGGDAAAKRAAHEATWVRLVERWFRLGFRSKWGSDEARGKRGLAPNNADDLSIASPLLLLLLLDAAAGAAQFL